MNVIVNKFTDLIIDFLKTTNDVDVFSSDLKIVSFKNDEIKILIGCNKEFIYINYNNFLLNYNRRKDYNIQQVINDKAILFEHLINMFNEINNNKDLLKNLFINLYGSFLINASRTSFIYQVDEEVLFNVKKNETNSNNNNNNSPLKYLLSSVLDGII